MTGRAGQLWRNERKEMDVKCMFYNQQSGYFNGSSYDGQNLAANTPPGMAAWSGEVDPTAVHVESGELVQGGVEPPAGLVWSAGECSWVVDPVAAAYRANRSRIQAEIDAIEARTLRPLRELRLAEAAGAPVPADSMTRLAQFDAEIVVLRAELQALSPEPSPAPAPSPSPEAG